MGALVRLASAYAPVTTVPVVLVVAGTVAVA